MGKYSKAIVAVLGSTITTLLALIPPETTLWIVLTVLSAALTAAGVYLVPNEPANDYQARHEGFGPGGGG